MLLGLMVLLPSACQAQREQQEAVSQVYLETAVPALRQRTYAATLVLEKELPGTEHYDAALMSYDSDQLKVYALVERPKIAMPQNGFPVVIFGHGFHPQPKQYGLSKADGIMHRPGDYYRGIPEAYAERGFLVVTPDYRGHGGSGGFEYTQTSYLAAGYYAIDVLTLLAALPALDAVDADNIFYVGHSMGGDVGLRTLLATQQIKAASFWSPVIATTYEQAVYDGRDSNGDTPITPATLGHHLEKVATRLGPYDMASQLASIDPVNFVAELEVPVIVHHANGDASVPIGWAEKFVAKLAEYNRPFEFFTYPVDDHLFKGEERRQAVTRDVSFFSRVSGITD